MSKRLVTIFQYVFFFSLGLFFAWLSVKDINKERWANIKTSVAQARQWLFIPVLIIILISHYSRTLRWKILMEPLGYKPSTFNTFAAMMIGYLVNLGVPRLGEVIKCTILARYEKIRADKLVGTIVVERTFDLICLIIVFVLSLVLEGDIIGGYMKEKLAVFLGDNAGNISTEKIIILISIFIVLIVAGYFLLKRFGHIDAVGKVKKILSGVWHGLNSVRFIKHKGLFIFHTILIWSLYLMGTTVGLYALKETSHLGIPGGLATLSVGSIGMIVTPGGIGAYPLLVSELMGLYGLDSATVGTALGWLLWTAQTLITVVVGFICFSLLSAFNKNRL
ncbi:MAG: flippase-like domain-containing protein [Bacteroidetes bacterium]|nr:flippase-like domain-containing protein [Bacteroidota bacterium]